MIMLSTSVKTIINNDDLDFRSIHDLDLDFQPESLFVVAYLDSQIFY